MNNISFYGTDPKFSGSSASSIIVSIVLGGSPRFNISAQCTFRSYNLIMFLSEPKFRQFSESGYKHLLILLFRIVTCYGINRSSIVRNGKTTNSRQLAHTRSASQVVASKLIRWATTLYLLVSSESCRLSTGPAPTLEDPSWKNVALHSIGMLYTEHNVFNLYNFRLM